MFDPYKVREDFPILGRKINGHNLIYFDNAATTQKPNKVIEGISYFYRELNANPLRSVHSLAQNATKAYNEAREKIAKFINAEPEEIIFVRNATEAINLVSFSLPFRKGDSVVTTYLEHHSNLLPWLRLKKNGINVKMVDIDENYELKMDDFEHLPRNTKLVTFTHASNVTGTITNAKKIIKLAHEARSLTLVDAAQSVPHMKVDVKELDCDFLAFSGHKMLGPLGIGVLYIKKDVQRQLSTFMEGGEMIQSVEINKIIYAEPPLLFEAGTQNIEGAYGLGLAVDYLNSIGMKNIERYEEKLTKYLYQKAKEINGIEILSGKSKQFGPILSFNIPGLHSHDVAFLLDKKGIEIRSGFHCAQPLIEDKLKANGAARASLYLYNTKEEIDAFTAELKEITKHLHG